MDPNGTAHRIQFALSFLLRLVLSLLFIYAAVMKLLDPTSFFSDVQSFRVVSGFAAVAVTYLVPSLEVVCAVGLWLPRYRCSSLVLLTSLLLAFTVIIGISWARGLDIDCGCFGRSESNQTNYPYLLVRDLALLLMAGLALGLECAKKRSSQKSSSCA